MYLFDVCERTFARVPVVAERFRELLRNARDRDSMLVVADEMLIEIETRAGSDRAGNVRMRIHELLPASETEESF